MKTALFATAAAMVMAATAASANSHVGMIIDAGDINSLTSSQERAAALYFAQQYSDGVFITPENIEDIDARKLDVIWLNFDRVGLGKGNLPGVFGKEETLEALKTFVGEGGNLFVTKMATQMIDRIGRIDSAYAPGIFGDGEGGKGTDVWTVNAQIGYMNAPDYVEPDPNREKDETQFYDHRPHPIYEGLTTNTDFTAETFALEGTGTGEEMWREDHNCCWDLNAYQYTADGRNTVEKFEAQNNCTVLGTWGHVIDFAVAGIIEFHAPVASEPEKAEATEDNGRAGVILANGLAAYEWAPREGVNAFHSNIEKMTSNALGYLSKNHATEIAPLVGADADLSVRWYDMQGREVRGARNTPGVYVMVRGTEASKVVVR